MRRWLLTAALLALLAAAAAQGAGAADGLPAGGEDNTDAGAAVTPAPDALADGSADAGSEQQLGDTSPQPADPTADQPQPANPTGQQEPTDGTQPTDGTTATDEKQAADEQAGKGATPDEQQPADDTQPADETGDGATADDQQQQQADEQQQAEDTAAQQPETYAGDGADGSGTADATDSQGDGMWQYIPPAPSPPAADPPVAAPSPSPTPAPQLPSASPSPLPPAPPAPIAWPVNVVVLIDGVPYPFTDEKAAQVATALQMVTPAFKWTAAAQQPFYYGKLPDMPPENSTATNTSTTAGPMQMVPVSGTTSVVPAALYPIAPIITAPAAATAPTAAPAVADPALPTGTYPAAGAAAAAVPDPYATAAAVDPAAAAAGLATDPAAAAAAAAVLPADPALAAAAAAMVPAATTAPGAVPVDTLSAAADGSQLVSVDPLAVNGLGGTGGRKMLQKQEADGNGGNKDGKAKGNGDKKETKQDEKKDGGKGGKKEAAPAPAPAPAEVAAVAGGASGDANLPLATEKGQCYSKKHALAPDEAGCAFYCEAKVASGEVKEEELAVYFYANKRSPNGAPNCCTCVKAAGNNNNAAAAGKDTAGDGNNTDNTNSTDASGYDNKSGDSGNAESSTKAGDGGNDSSSDDGDSKGGKGGKGDDKKDGGEGKKKDSEDRKSHNERRNATAQEKPATPNGVYLFAQTFVTNFTEEQALNTSIRLASKNGMLLSNLQQAAGVAAKSVDIVFLGSGPYQFAPLPFKYVRPAASADEATAAEADASSGTSNGALIGIILGVVCGVVLLVAIVSAFAIRRHRLKKNDGQALVRKWEAERRYAEESRRAAMEERRASSQRALDRVLSKDGKTSSSSGRPPRAASSVTANSSTQSGSSLDRMRAALGLRKDHLAAAAARMDAADAAAAAASSSSARRAPSTAGSDIATPLPAADFNASSGHPSPAPSVMSEVTQGSSVGSEVPLTSVVVRQVGAAGSSSAPAPSWATRDPGQAPKKGGFWTFGRS